MLSHSHVRSAIPYPDRIQWFFRVLPTICRSPRTLGNNRHATNDLSWLPMLPALKPTFAQKTWKGTFYRATFEGLRLPSFFSYFTHGRQSWWSKRTTHTSFRYMLSQMRSVTQVTGSMSEDRLKKGAKKTRSFHYSGVLRALCRSQVLL